MGCLDFVVGFVVADLAVLEFVGFAVAVESAAVAVDFAFAVVPPVLGPADFAVQWLIDCYVVPSVEAANQ